MDFDAGRAGPAAAPGGRRQIRLRTAAPACAQGAYFEETYFSRRICGTGRP